MWKSKTVLAWTQGEQLHSNEWPAVLDSTEITPRWRFLQPPAHETSRCSQRPPGWQGTVLPKAPFHSVGSRRCTPVDGSTSNKLTKAMAKWAATECSDLSCTLSGATARTCRSCVGTRTEPIRTFCTMPVQETGVFEMHNIYSICVNLVPNEDTLVRRSCPQMQNDKIKMQLITTSYGKSELHRDLKNSSFDSPSMK